METKETDIGNSFSPSLLPVEYPQLVESDRVNRIQSLFHRAVEVLGDTEVARIWFESPLSMLGGKSPVEYADMEEGAREIEDLLGRLEQVCSRGSSV